MDDGQMSGAERQILFIVTVPKHQGSLNEQIDNRLQFSHFNLSYVLANLVKGPLTTWGQHFQPGLPAV